MADWAKVKFFWETMLGSTGSTLKATTTESTGDYDVSYLNNMLEVNSWMAANTTTPMYIVFSNNKLTNNDFETWSSGPSSAPDNWTLNGAGATVARDAVNKYTGNYGVALTYGSAPCYLYARPFTPLADFQGKTITFGCWVKTSVANQARVVIDAAVNSFSPYHTGGGGWEWLEVTQTLTNSETFFILQMRLEVAGTAYFDTCSAGIPFSADYLAIMGHNLNTIGANISLTYSKEDYIYGTLPVAAISSDPVLSDGVYLKEFTNPGAFVSWRLVIAGTLSAAPYMTICIWGNKTELDYLTGSFDPDAEEVSANTNLSYGGYVTGVHRQYSERRLAINFQDGDPALYQKVKAWWEGSGLKNFFVGWETANRPDEVYLMRPGSSFVNAFTYGGAYRNITIKLSGRKE